MTAQVSNKSQASETLKLGDLPEWKLDDLYPGPDSEAFAGDLDKAGKQAKAFAEQWRGKLTDAAAAGGDELVKAVKAYEALGDLLGRIGSYAMLHYVGDTTDPARGKFFGDAQQQLTDISTRLLFFELEFNKI
ncbi:MAG: M3 family oligoendopeptidase, partial [Aestuariivirgaceae bacterium]